MPLYPGTAGLFTRTLQTPPALYHGDRALLVGTLDVFTGLVTAEAFVAGNASISVALGGAVDNHPGTLSIEGFTSATAGVFELDLQTADTDADAYYQQEGLGITTQNAATFAFRGEFINVTALFARILFKTFPNAVNTVVRIIRR